MPYKFTPVDHDPWEGAKSGPDWASMIDAVKDKLVADKSYEVSSREAVGADAAPEGYLQGVVRRAGEVGKERLAEAADTLSAPGDVLFGRRPMTPEQLQDYGSRLGGYVMLGGLGRAALAGEVPETSTLGIIAGRNSHTADLQALQEREALGGHPRNVSNWRSTGWYFGPEGLPKYEIPDQSSRVTAMAGLLKNPGDSAPLGMVLQHPELYQAYPQLSGMKVSVDPGLSIAKGQWGYYDKGEIKIAPGLAQHPEFESVMLHEMQHGVQDIEGFAKGANTSNYFDPRLHQQATDLYAEGQKLLAGRAPSQLNPAERQKFLDINAGVSKYNKFTKEQARAGYKASAGENEANVVSDRLNMNPNELGITPPWISKVPIDLQDVVPWPARPGYSRGPTGFGPEKAKPLEELLGEPAPQGGKGPGTPEDMKKSTEAAEETPSAKEVPPPAEVQRLVSDAQAKSWTVDRTHDVPYGAGSAADSGRTYIDRRIPSKMTVGGKSFDPAEFLKVHEQIEHELMTKGGMSYEHAHHFATAEERAKVEAAGLNWRKYEKAMEKWLDVTEEERGDQKLPPDLYTKPYSHSDLRKFKGKKEMKL